MEENELFHDIQFLLGVCFNVDNSHTFIFERIQDFKALKKRKIQVSF